jgi:hypothetical protein
MRISHLGDQRGGPLIFPVVERPRARHLEAVEEAAADGAIRPAGELRDVGLDGPRSQANRRRTHEEILAAQLCPQDGDGLGQGMPRVFRWRVGPQQLAQGVARECVSRLEGEPDQQRKVLARAEADGLPGAVEQLRFAQAGQVEG